VNIRRFLRAFAVLLAQQSALVHAFEHAAHDAKVASLGHDIEKCVAYDALGHALEGSLPVPGASLAPVCPNTSPELPLIVLGRAVFDSRAPPASA
jgi:hypothetical protein